MIFSPVSQLEIERKFIVPREHQKLFVSRGGGTEIVQAYLTSDPSAQMRVRIAKDALGEKATLTKKGPPSDDGLVRSEVEHSISVESAHALMRTQEVPWLNKTRHSVRGPDGAEWAVDVLRVNRVAGRPPEMWRFLVLAEHEADSIEKVNSVALPDWVGTEVTNNPVFSMFALTTESSRDAAWRIAYEIKKSK